MISSLNFAEIEVFHMVAGLALLTTGAFSVLAFLLRRKLAIRGVMALHLLNMLVVLISLFALYQPKGTLYGGISMLLLIGMIRAMSKFENTDKS